MSTDTNQGARGNGSALPGPTHAEVFGLPTSGTYGGNRQRRHRGPRPRIPKWYSALCETWSRAAWAGEITWEHAARLVDLWHPIALEQALTPGRKRQPQRIELDMYAALLGCGVDEETARHLVALEARRVRIHPPPRFDHAAEERQEGA